MLWQISNQGSNPNLSYLLKKLVEIQDSKVYIEKLLRHCREGKIPDLSQADTSYYQVHKIQPITKRHVLLLSFAITTQKLTEICQVSCKKQLHISTCKRWHKQSSMCKWWHMQSSACKRWHKRTNQVVTCHQSDFATCRSPSPKTLINKSLPKSFKERWSHLEIKPSGDQAI